MNVLLLTSHAIAEYDDLRMLTDLGYDTFSIGGAYDEVPFEGKRPALDVPRYPELTELVHLQRAAITEERGDPGPYIDWAKAWLHDDIIDWADAIIVHHFPERWIGDQWMRIRHKRVIWRTCGQSDPRLEQAMEYFHRDGMEIVRYSPAERRAFERGGWAGEDAVIRFGKYPGDYGPWTGGWVTVGNITQDMAKRGEACGLDRWNAITEGLSVTPAGPGSEVLRGGMGALSYEEMLAYLRNIRTYLYLGTVPASYTLGLIEAMLSGVPVIAERWKMQGADWRWLDDLWEADDILKDGDLLPRREFLRMCLTEPESARIIGEETRQRAVDLFGMDMVGPQWQAFLG